MPDVAKQDPPEPIWRLEEIINNISVDFLEEEFWDDAEEVFKEWKNWKWSFEKKLKEARPEVINCISRACVNHGTLSDTIIPENMRKILEFIEFRSIEVPKENDFFQVIRSKLKSIEKWEAPWFKTYIEKSPNPFYIQAAVPIWTNISKTEIKEDRKEILYKRMMELFNDFLEKYNKNEEGWKERFIGLISQKDNLYIANFFYNFIKDNKYWWKNIESIVSTLESILYVIWFLRAEQIDTSDETSLTNEMDAIIESIPSYIIEKLQQEIQAKQDQIDTYKTRQELGQVIEEKNIIKLQKAIIRKEVQIHELKLSVKESEK